MRQPFVLARQRRRRDLRHHEARIQTRARREKRRQAFVERGIDEPLDPPLGDSRESGQGDAEKVQSKCEGLAMKISAGENVV